MEKYDIVYVLKNGIAPYELLYSLRSVDQNFPHNSVWFYGGDPVQVKPDHMISYIQSGENKWDKVRNTLIRICENDSITENFYLFNDDFFVLKPVTDEFVNWAYGTLQERIDEILEENKQPSKYTSHLDAMQQVLRGHGYDTVNFDLHVPMLVNRADALEVLNADLPATLFRSLYGNVKHIPYIEHEDVKIYDQDSIPKDSWDYCSTQNVSFLTGAVGRWLRTKFNEPCRFEG